MSTVTDELSAAASELISLADEFAERARTQEVGRDRARPGTGAHHQYAHSATLWRSAERQLRARAVLLGAGADALT